MSGEVSEAVQKCCGLLKNASTDTDKFAAIFMVTKLVRGKNATPAAKVALFEAIGFDFLRKLLTSSNVPVDCPPNMYRSLALSILNIFCTEECLVKEKKVLDFIPILFNIISKGDDEDESLMEIGEAYNCLKGLAAFDAGRDALNAAGGLDKFNGIFSAGGFQSDDALNVLIRLLSSEKGMKNATSYWNTETFDALLSKIALEFETDQDKRKFELAEYLNIILFNCPKEILTGEGAVIEVWSQSIYKGLSDILRSKIGAAQRNPALILASTTLNVLGTEKFILEAGKQTFLLLVHLAGIEIKMQLEGKDISNNKHLITACYIVIEEALTCIGNDTIDLEQNERCSTYTSFKGTLTSVTNYLLKVADSKKAEDPLFINATIRVLISWLAQETGFMHPQILRLLPFFLKTAANNPDIFRVFLPALCHLTVDTDARVIILKEEFDKILIEKLKSYWTIVVKNKGDDVPDARTAMISICNVLMNLTVLEPKHIEQSVEINKLLRFILDNLRDLKETQENLVLHGNLAVLGLLLLKRLHNKVKKNDFSLCRFVQVTIRFLWDAYVIDESINGRPPELTVAMQYKERWTDELMELWFLGMQTVTDLVNQISWVIDFIIESGWAEGIVEMLKKVQRGKLQAEIKSVFEDFLCNLIEADKEAKVAEVLKKADVIKVCRNQKMMNLGKKLFGD